MPRFRHLTKIGLRRLKCEVEGCSNKGYGQWNVCADQVGKRTQYRVMCKECDISINAIVMTWVFGDTPEIQEKIRLYKRRVMNDYLS